MIFFTEKQKTAIRYLISVNMSVIFGFLAAGMVSSQARYFFGHLLVPVSVITVVFGLTITAIYASLIGQISFNVWAIVGGWLTGAVSALIIVRMEIIPYSILVPLILTSLVTTILTFLIKSKIFPGLDRLVMVIHVISIFIVAWGTVYSLWNRWLHPWGVVFAIDCFTLWSPSIVGPCPLTLVEKNARGAKGEHTKLGEESFVQHYLKKWFRIKITLRTSRNVPRVIAIIMFSGWIIGYLIRGI
jgi:hypothetical protein